VNIAQILQRSGLLLVAMKSSGIREPKDLNGKRVGFWVGDFYLPNRAFLAKHGLHVHMIPNYTTVTILLKGAVDAVGAMWYNEYHTILDSGYDPDELTVFRLGDLGADFPEDGLYCREQTYLAHPELCDAFVSASLKGWTYAFEHPEEAVDIVMKYANKANTGTNQAHQRWMLAGIKDLTLPKGMDHARLGKLRYEDYKRVGEELKRLFLVQEIPEFDKFYRGRR
jgi:NitT/TauT family transport system substrate-binding protein